MSLDNRERIDQQSGEISVSLLSTELTKGLIVRLHVIFDNILEVFPRDFQFHMSFERQVPYWMKLLRAWASQDDSYEDVGNIASIVPSLEELPELVFQVRYDIGHRLDSTIDFQRKADVHRNHLDQNGVCARVIAVVPGLVFVTWICPRCPRGVQATHLISR